MMPLILPHKPRRRRWRPFRQNGLARICWLIEEAVAAAFAVSVQDLRAPARGTAAVAFARQCAMYLACMTLGTSRHNVGRMFHRDRTTVAHACEHVEWRRDDPALDRMLNLLEVVCIDIAQSKRIEQQVQR